MLIRAARQRVRDRRQETAIKPKSDAGSGWAGEVEDFLRAVPPDARAALEKIRETIRKAAPDATERIGYGIPMFYYEGPLVGFGATKNHCAFYVMSPALMEANRDELQRYDTAKGTIRFTPGNPLPATLVRKLVKARIAENHARRSC
jgi:uncharacterized protein YdhG (YjbR/CyaY superfamily)